MVPSKSFGSCAEPHQWDGRDVNAVDCDPASVVVRLESAYERQGERTLAGAGASDDCDALSGPDVKVDVSQSGFELGRIPSRVVVERDGPSRWPVVWQPLGGRFRRFGGFVFNLSVLTMRSTELRSCWIKA